MAKGQDKGKDNRKKKAPTRTPEEIRQRKIDKKNR